ncbi:serine/threonine protein kinase [Streptomyces davaonensis JCM 4913]|uniref:non-specific serine/threonine protein kinase n=1 Tax=Streptomyces davaonensis (strain DSM 101723 / JCM 4913 / KCC S-0913 / 768) TaxID=1214101 RepID=K4REJ7_STRDJ|nr:serine/threonine-protein kinase [Streptomyces davaonensis]CCK32218.1 serine/threonine protein kinase [Streptomyces davaonensis JCM 4913]
MSSGEYGQTDGAGRLLAGRYRVLAQLGRGGMGVVWRAADEVLGREVAVKELRTYTDADGPELDGLRVRMQREARAAARVRHPGVVAVHDVAEVDGRPLIVMELVDGPSLDDVLRERGTLDPYEAAGIGAKVMDALAAAHRAGVLHRDVKPGNILLDRSGRVVLTDFGIATMEDPGDGSATHLTRSGELVGSLDYLAPERAQGADPGPASDVWALGATLYAAVEGSSPFRRTSTFSTLTAIVSEPLPEPHRAGPLAPVLQRLLDKRPEGRPEAEEARELLQTVADRDGTDTPTTTLRATPPERTLTERAVPTVPQGFGPPVPPQDPSASGAVAPQTTTSRLSRGRSRVLLAAAAVALVLASAGATVAVLNNGDETEASGQPTETVGTADSATSESGGGASPDGSADAEPTDRDDDKSPTPSRSTETEPSAKPSPSPTPTPSKTSGAGGGASSPAAACHSIGGGKYNCDVWRTAKSYTADGTEVGVLGSGTNYFYCQQNLGRRETYGEWTNVWWAKTDDDSGNADVWVSDVYVRGGDNDGPVPGLPVC